MRGRFLLFLAIVVALAAQAVLASGALAATPAWTSYRHDAAQSGIDPDSTNPVTPTPAWQTPSLDGEVYGQPLVYGAYVYVATENDTVYELDAATGAVVWANHLATPEPSSAAPCGDIAPSIGITSTPVIDPNTNRIYAVGAVSSGGIVQHELFALDLSSGQPVPGFPMVVDPPYPSGDSAVNQLQRVGLTLDGGRVLIGYGGNDGDCSTYWGWLVSAPASGIGGLSWFQADPDHHAGAIWASGNAPPVDGSGNVFLATGNGIGNASSNPDFGDAVVKLNPSAAALDWWAPTNWQSLDASDGDLGSSMPTLLPGGYLFQSGKDHNGYVLDDAALGGVSSPVAQVSGFCPGGSFGGAVYDPGHSTIYAACNSGLKALAFGSGSPPSLSSEAGFSAPAGAIGPPMIAGGLVWVTSHSPGALYGLDPTTGAALSEFSIPESGSQVNHFASPSAGGGRLFVGSGNQVTAFTIAQPTTTGAGTSTTTATSVALSALRISPRRASVAGRKVRGRCVKPTKRNNSDKHCRRPTTLKVTFILNESATVRFTIERQAVGRKVKRNCVRETKRNRKHARCSRWVALRGSITFTGQAGSNAFRFSPKIGGRLLLAGTYQLTATPDTGGHAGQASSVIFKLVS